MAEIFQFPDNPEKRQRIRESSKLEKDRDYFDRNRAVVRVAFDRQKAFSKQFFINYGDEKEDKKFFARKKDTFSKMSLEGLTTEAGDIDEGVWSNNPTYALSFFSALEDRVERCGGFYEIDDQEG